MVKKQILDGIPLNIARRFIELCADNNPLDSFRVLQREGVIEKLENEGIKANFNTFNKIWSNYVNHWIVKLHKGKTRTELADALGFKDILLDEGMLRQRLVFLAKAKEIDLKRMKLGSKGSRDPTIHLQHFIGVPHKLERGLSLRKKPKRRRPGK